MFFVGVQEIHSFPCQETKYFEKFTDIHSLFFICRWIFFYKIIILNVSEIVQGIFQQWLKSFFFNKWLFPFHFLFVCYRWNFPFLKWLKKQRIPIVGHKVLFWTVMSDSCWKRMSPDSNKYPTYGQYYRLCNAHARNIALV